MAMKTARAHESRSKPRQSTVAPDYWAFLEEIDAPMWVDFTLQGNSDGEERDDSWFDTLHPFHQRSFQDLVSPVMKVKGKVSKLGYVSPIHVSSVTKSRGKMRANQACLRNKVGQIQLNLSELNSPCDRQIRSSAGKISSVKSNSIDSSGVNSGFRKPSNSTEAESSTTVSTSSDNESRNPMVGKSESSRPCNRLNRSIVPQHTTAMPRSNGLLASLKTINLKRSGGTLPALRVEVKGQQQSRDGKSSASKFSTEYHMAMNRQASSTVSYNYGSQHVKKERERVKSNLSQNGTISPVGHSKEKLRIWSSGNVDEKSRKDCESANRRAQEKMKTEALLTAKLAPGQSIKDRKRGVLSMQIISASRPPLRDVNSVCKPLYKSVTGQYPRSTAAGQENNTLCTTLHQTVNMRERVKPLRSIKHGTYHHVFNGKRILNVGTFA